ncbi:hypothetical protein [Zhongshania marina]|uniref:Uncharacterized protein n=1 Tax=Zhongshania marina TaxID=2304603 RepID=A0A2S4HH03_9GAMM|nr:hypothetical protein [Marortus luteolus]POP53267.1 hypothetical protein C0068_07490 [Marortus luteolus]
MDIEYTNFDGDWAANCPYCGKPQVTHQVDLGEFEGKKYIHRQPCEEEQYQIRKRAVKRGIVNRSIILAYDIVMYIWGLIPFKEEIKLVFSTVKHCLKSIKAVLYLRSTKPKHNKRL